jgi:transcriptional regulator with XRE-family HTH domain
MMMTKTTLEIREILRNRRISMGLTQVDVADMMGTSQSVISEYENGVVQPTLPIFIKWANVLNFRVTLETIK